MAERVEKRHQAADEARHPDRFFHSLWVQQWAFNKLVQSIEVPFGIVLGQHYLGETIRFEKTSQRRVIYLGFKERRLECFIVHLHAHFQLDLFNLSLAAANGIFDGVGSITAIGQI